MLLQEDTQELRLTASGYGWGIESNLQHPKFSKREEEYQLEMAQLVKGLLCKYEARDDLRTHV